MIETSDLRGAEAPRVAWHALHASTPCMRAARGARGTVMRREVQPRASTVACEGGRATTRGAAPRVCAGRRRARTPNCCVRGRPGDDAWCACLCSSPARESCGTHPHPLCVSAGQLVLSCVLNLNYSPRSVSTTTSPMEWKPRIERGGPAGGSLCRTGTGWRMERGACTELVGCSFS